MKRLSALLSKNSNYVYHMLSVSKAGYNNEYGNKYAKYHEEKDIESLNKYQKYITVKGGEHCGELYWILVSVPASIDDSLSLVKYYNSLLHLFTSHDVEENHQLYGSYNSLLYNTVLTLSDFHKFYDRYKSLSNVICLISDIMISNYNIYDEKIWYKEKKKIKEAVDKSNEIFNSKDYVGLWESFTKYSYPHSNFNSIICSSINDGPQAIDISQDKDIFELIEDSNHFTQLVSHELGIYIIRNQLLDLINTHGHLKSWPAIESLAGFYNELIIKEKILCWNGKEEYRKFYKKLYYSNKNITPREMFEKAIKEFNIEKSRSI